ncbi:energy transducer TonB [Maribacter sp. 2304DJ31-5]|uniref:energy transducer TonB n=1 Tax=Maribacter sp. 2304DJ31-5 TaxID=3386273 RepID=UPI0039BD56FD
MKPKKNPKADLNRDSGLFFVIGLTFVLFVVWRALEMKTYDSDTTSLVLTENIDNLDEDVPVTKALNTPPPPPPPAAPEIIQVVEDIEDIEETIIESTESGEEMAIEDIIAADDITVDEVEEDIEVPFMVIENPPVFPGCENIAKEKQKDCFKQKMQEHIQKHFQYPAEALELGLNGKVFVIFVIDSNGKTVKIRTRGPHKVLEKEANRIIAMLPKMKPGRQRNRNVSVPYSIPINFRLLR